MSDEGHETAPRVLIVEDSATQATALQLQLEERFATEVAGSLAEAREALRAPFDVVLLDLELPDASGLEAVRRFERDHPELPVVVMTSRHGTEVAMDALREGAEDYVPKDELEPSVLGRALRYAIGRHRTRNELRALNAQKDHLMGVVAHDLRNPLSVVRGYADFLLSGVAGELDEEHDEVMRTIRRTSDYMLHLVEDLVDFSRIQAGELELELEPTDLAALVREGIRLNAMLAQKKGIHLETKLSSDLPEVSVDRHKVRQILDNLLTNAVKFSHPDTTVEVTLAREDDRAHLAVRDRGVGIPEQDLPKLFQPFEKTSARPTAGERSTGLGLAIVRNIVEAHGGRIWVESRVGQGSTFHVTLPLPA
ncbi:MAG TPA: hybrid sensor histidine kinase/response regulator [Sandaracinaceae bacterium LLY-WYZ-13_1]|nr:hybrid sensor histidine kinase/response regulator [Sandaracinaceae bacterium LLY-WYZ-13_1]